MRKCCGSCRHIDRGQPFIPGQDPYVCSKISTEANQFVKYPSRVDSWHGSHCGMWESDDKPAKGE